MEKRKQSMRRVWRILLIAEAAAFLLLAALRLTNAVSFRLAYLPMLLLLFLAGDALLLLFRYDRRHAGESAYREKRRIALLLLLIACLASLPLFTNYLPNGHDIQFHLFRIEGVRDGLADGQFPVRIHPNTLYGHGYANPEFYPELLLYFPAALRLCGFSVMGAYKVFLFCLNLLTAAFSYYACARVFRSRKLGVLGSAFYTLSLYRLVNLYTRAAIGEASAMTFLPLIAVGIYAILFDEREKPALRRAFLPLTVGMTGLLYTHLLSCEMTLPLLLAFCLAFYKRTFTGKRFLSILQAAIATVLLSLAFLVPMLCCMGVDTYRVFEFSTGNLAKEAVNLAQLFPLLPNAVGESNMASMGAKGEMPLGVGFVTLCALLLFPALSAKAKRDGVPGQGRKPLWFCWIAALALLLMSTNLFPWNAIYNMGGVMAKVFGMPQFPWRLLSLVTLLATFVFCACFPLLASLESASLRRCLAASLCLVLLFTSVAYCDRFLQDSDALVINANTDLDQRRSVGDGEYLPKGASDRRVDLVDEPTNIGAGLSIEDFSHDGTHVAFRAENAAAEASVDLPLLYYLGYEARDGEGNLLPLTKGEFARIRVTVPAGYAGMVSVRYAEPGLWRVAEAVTFLTALALCAYALRQRRRFPADAALDGDANLSIFE